MRRKQIESIENLLMEAYKRQPLPDFPANWQEDVMREIGKIKLEKPFRPSLIEKLFPGPILFKFAGAAAACAMAFIAIFLSSGGGIEREFAELFLNDPFTGLSLILLSL